MDALHQTVDFDAGGVFLVDPSKGKVGSIHTVGYDAALDADLQLKIGQGLIGHVANSAEPVIVPDVRSDDRYVDARHETCSEIVVPMLIDGKVIGVVNLESNQLNAFDNHALELLLAFSSQAALSIERARMHEEILAGHRLHQQIDIARDIQRSFLPKSDPVLEGYDICGRNVPSEQVGGDYFDFIRIVDDQTGIAIADVSGKGIPAALIMASVRASLIAEIRNNYSIRTICQKVNNLLCESLQPGNFVTALYSVLDSRNHILTFCNCGHDRPILMHGDGEIEYLIDGGPVFGVAPDAVYRERPIFLHRGDLVMLFTDGVTETFDQSDGEFGYKRLEQILKNNRNRSAESILEEVFKAVHDFAGPDHVFDDLTMIVLKRL
jgi:sigma-B regulation protein RsbU (phosphoserine phosphatase)